MVKKQAVSPWASTSGSWYATKTSCGSWAWIWCRYGAPSCPHRTVPHSREMASGAGTQEAYPGIGWGLSRVELPYLLVSSLSMWS